MSYLRIVLYLLLLLFSNSNRCFAVNEGLDLRLAVSIAEQKIADFDSELLTAVELKRFAAIERCYEELRLDDLGDASEQLDVYAKLTKESLTKGDDSSHQASILNELEDVASVAILLSKKNYRNSPDLLSLLPAKSMEEDERDEANRQLISEYNYLRARLLRTSGEYDQAHKLFNDVYQERKNRFGARHVESLTVLADLMDVRLVTDGAESICETAERCYEVANRYATVELANDMAAIYAQALFETGRTKPPPAEAGGFDRFVRFGMNSSTHDGVT